MGLDPMRRAVNTLMPGRDVALPPASFAGKKHESNQRRFGNPHRLNHPETACLMTFRAEKARRNGWARVAALSTAARVGSGVR
jgi:hypothetical protein